MKKMVLSIFVLIITIFYITLRYPNDDLHGRIYDCGMAEWHPDIPPKVKEECRRINSQQDKGQQGKSRGYI